MTSIPTVHINGSDAQTLLDANMDVLATLRILDTKIREAAPNARDYYVDGSGVYELARKEHDVALRAIQGVADRYFEIVEGIRGQIEARDARRRGR